jgi:hypothetical protein
MSLGNALLVLHVIRTNVRQVLRLARDLIAHGRGCNVVQASLGWKMVT